MITGLIAFILNDKIRIYRKHMQCGVISMLKKIYIITTFSSYEYGKRAHGTNLNLNSTLKPFLPCQAVIFQLCLSVTDPFLMQNVSH